MELTNDFLPKDYPAAVKEYICIMDCLAFLQEAIENSNYKKAGVLAENIARSLNELGRLHDRKLQLEKARNLVIKLNIDLSTLERLGK